MIKAAERERWLVSAWCPILATMLDPETDTAPPLRHRLLVVVPLAAFVAATTHWMSWQEPPADDDLRGTDGARHEPP